MDSSDEAAANSQPDVVEAGATEVDISASGLQAVEEKAANEAVVPPPTEQAEAAAEPVGISEPEDVVVDVPITPGAVKFMDTMTDVGSRVGTLAPDDVSDGMFELSRRCSRTMKQTFGAFKDHALDLAITATTEPTIGSEQTAVWRRVSRKTEWRKLIQLPVAALYAMLTLLCVVTFAMIYFEVQLI